MFSGLNIHHAELTAVFAAPASFFLTTPMGRILNRFSQVRCFHSEFLAVTDSVTASGHICN